MSKTLRSKLIRLANNNPNLRPKLLPLLKQGGISSDTQILPGVVADTVIRELIGYFWDDKEITNLIFKDIRKLTKLLMKHAEAVYESDDRFRKTLQSRGNKGRDSLYSFMRHWLAAEIKKSRKLNHLYPLLPAGFALGKEPQGRYQPV